MTADKTAPLVLVDGSSYLYRAFHALPPLTTSSGRPTGAVKGVISMLRRLAKDYPDSTIAVVFDAKGKTFRDDLYEEYKANRPSMPEELREQVAPIHDIVRAMGLPLLCVEGVEADDVIGTLAARATADGRDVVVSTGDKDMAQLVNPHVTLVNTMTDTRLDEAGVVDKFGLSPAQVVDYMALMGDKVDNIPGVPGVGEKTARALIQGLGDLDAVYANPEAVRELPIRGAKKLPEKLRAEKDSAYLSRALATIKTDVDLDFGPETLAQTAPDNEQLLSLYQSLEFRAWTEELLSGDGAGAAPERDYHTVLSAKAWHAWLRRLRDADYFAFDTETTSLNYRQARVVGVSVAVTGGEAAYVPFGHDYPGVPDQLSEADVLGALKPLLEDPAVAKIGQNLKYDRNVLANHGIHLQGMVRDTMLESYVLDSTATRHDMDSLALKYLGEKTTHYEEIAGKGRKQLTFNDIALEQAGPYAAEDADITWRLDECLWPRLQAEPGLCQVFTDIEMPLVPVLADMEYHGALLAVDRLHAQSRVLGEQLEALEARAHELAGESFNLGSPKQLGAILFDKQSLPVIKKTPKGQPSTAEAVLAELAEDYELPRVIMEYRACAKLKSTYTDKLPEMAHPETGRVHTSYHQAVTATGRLSSSDPNLQNIPIRSEAGRRIRQAFVAPEGYCLVAADYSQIELRIMAHLSGDTGLREAFAQGLDIHQATAAEVFGVALDAVSAEQRRRAKAINFGLIYGMSAFGLARQLDLGRQEAQDYIDRYFARYPDVRAYMDRTREQAAERGYVETLFGRRLYLPEIRARNNQHRQAAERTAINAPMQGTAADIIKRAMIAVHDWLADSALDARMIMQVHDELILEVADADTDAVIAGLRERMEQAAELSVPLVVDVGTGENWDEAH